MATTNISIRIDEELKKQFETVVDSMGMNITTAFTVFAKNVVRQNKIPFEITGDPFYSESNQAHLMKSIAQYHAGSIHRHELIEVSEDE